MADAQRLFEEYKQAASEAGPPDPVPFVSQVSGTERQALIALIDAYLEQAPRQEFDAAAFRDSKAAPLAESVQRSLAGAGGLWPALLPRLRNQARIRRADLVAELAARLGAQGQREKVGDYYHQMEQGRLPASGVSDTVLDALGAIVGYGRDALRKAGELPAAGAPSVQGGEVFARIGGPAPLDPDMAFSMAEMPDTEEWDEVDRLFRGDG